VRRATKGKEEDEDDEDNGKEDKGRERSEMAEESGEGASEAEAEGLVGRGVNEIWMPWVPMVQSRYEVASSKSVRSDTLAPPNATYHTIPYQQRPPPRKKKQ